MDLYGLYCLDKDDLSAIHDTVAGAVTGGILAAYESKGNPLASLTGVGVGAAAGFLTNGYLASLGIDSNGIAASSGGAFMSGLSGDPMQAILGFGVAAGFNALLSNIPADSYTGQALLQISQDMGSGAAAGLATGNLLFGSSIAAGNAFGSLASTLLDAGNDKNCPCKKGGT